MGYFLVYVASVGSEGIGIEGATFGPAGVMYENLASPEYGYPSGWYAVDATDGEEITCRCVGYEPVSVNVGMYPDVGENVDNYLTITMTPIPTPPPPPAGTGSPPGGGI